MSTKIMLEIARHSRAKGNAKLVLLLLASYAHPDGTHAEMSLSTIARESGLSRRQVNTIVHFLAETGHVLLESGAGTYGTNRYAVQRPWLSQGNGFPRATTSPGAITAPLVQPLPTIDKENKDLTKQSCEEIALGQPLHQPVVTAKAAALVKSWVGPDFAQVLQGATTQEPAPPAPRAKTPRQPALYFQGKLCPGGHDDGTGHTLRLVSNNNCTECNVAKTRAKRQAAAAIRNAQRVKPARQVIDLAVHRQRQEG